METTKKIKKPTNIEQIVLQYKDILPMDRLCALVELNKTQIEKIIKKYSNDSQNI